MPAEAVNHFVGPLTGYVTDAAVDAFIAGNSWTKAPGWLYLNSTDSSLRVWDGAQWNPVTTGIAGRGCAPLAYAFTSQGVSSGTFYTAGYYKAPAAAAQLDEGSPSQAYGAANVGYCAHAFIVAGGAGVVASGLVKLQVSGTSYDPTTGTRTAADTEDIVADITTLSQDDYVQSDKQWIGTVTFSLVIENGAPATYSLDFNYGLALVECANRQDFRVICFEYQGYTDAADTDFDVELLAHDGTGWTYDVAAFVPGGTVIAQLSSLFVTEDNVALNDYFGLQRFSLSYDLTGTDCEGFVIRVTTGAPNTVQVMTFRVGIQFLTS